MGQTPSLMAEKAAPRLKAASRGNLAIVGTLMTCKALTPVKVPTKGQFTLLEELGNDRSGVVDVRWCIGSSMPYPFRPPSQRKNRSCLEQSTSVSLRSR